MNLVELDTNELSCVVGGAAPPPFPPAINIYFGKEWDVATQEWVTPKQAPPGMVLPGQIP